MSRLGRKLEHKTKRQIFLYVLVICLVLFLIIKYAFLLLDKIGSVLIGFNEAEYSKKITESKTDEIILAPTLDSLATATNSASIKISGRSYETKGTIELFLNETLKNETEIFQDGLFAFGNIDLKEGENTIKVRYKNPNSKISKFSEINQILYLRDAPKLEITNPSDNSLFGKENQEITITGKTDPDNKIQINGYQAVVDGNGNFSYLLRLKDGENEINIEAVNLAQSKTSKKIKVIFRP